MSSPDHQYPWKKMAKKGGTKRMEGLSRTGTHRAVIFRADADAAIGTGHIMRCYALASALIGAGIDVIFVTAGEFPALEPRLKQAGIILHHIEVAAGSAGDAEETCAVAERSSARWIVADGYHFCAEFQEAIKKAGFRLLVIDDFGHSGRYFADIILNQYPYADAGFYRDRGSAKALLLLGTRYALLREEFITARQVKHPIPRRARRVLVTLGGGDYNNTTGQIIQILQQLPAGSVEITVVAGGCNPHIKELENLASQSRHPLELLRNVQAMANLYLRSDCAIASGGSTTLELACLGIPMITVVIAENQVRVCESLESAGAALNAGRIDEHQGRDLPDLLEKVLCSRAIRMRLSKNSRQLIDAKGARRVAVILEEDLFHARMAQESDCLMVYRWANDPYIRKISFNTDQITPDEHREWFFKKIRDPDVVYYILEDRGNNPVGQVRFDIAEGEATISITIAPEYRGMNYGTKALRFSAGVFFHERDIRIVHAYIKKGNTISCRAFRSAGFVDRGFCRTGAYDAIHMTLERDAL